MPGCRSHHFDKRQSVGLQNFPKARHSKIKCQRVRKFVNLSGFFLFRNNKVQIVKYRKPLKEATKIIANYCTDYFFGTVCLIKHFICLLNKYPNKYHPLTHLQLQLFLQFLFPVSISRSSEGLSYSHPSCCSFN